MAVLGLKFSGCNQFSGIASWKKCCFDMLFEGSIFLILKESIGLFLLSSPCHLYVAVVRLLGLLAFQLMGSGGQTDPASVTLWSSQNSVIQKFVMLAIITFNNYVKVMLHIFIT